MAEMVVTKALETEAVVRQQRKQREHQHSGYIGCRRWNQSGSGDSGEKNGGGGGGGGSGMNKGSDFGGGDIALSLADNSGNGEAGNGCRNRGAAGQ